MVCKQSMGNLNGENVDHCFDVRSLDQHCVVTEAPVLSLAMVAECDTGAGKTQTAVGEQSS